MTYRHTNNLDIVSEIGALGAEILAQKVAELRLRQSALEEALSETAQALHSRCHPGNHIGEWRACWSEPCVRLRRLMDLHVDVPLVVDP